MSTRAEQITAALETKLKAAPDIASGNVYRTKLNPVSRDVGLAVVLMQGQDLRVAESTLKTHYRQLTIKVEIYARGDIPDQLADPVIEDVVTRIMSDRGLSGLCDDISIGNVLPDWIARDEDLVVKSIEFLVDYESDNSVL